MSVRASTSRPSTCSGAIYCSVPRIVPCAVMASFAVGSWGSGVARRLLPQFRQAKVQQLRTRLGQHDVAWLQIAMRDTLSVSFIQRIGDFDGVLQNLLQRQGTFLQSVS